MRPKPMAILSTGCFTPVGTNTIQTVTSIYAGIAGISQSPFVDRDFESLRFGFVPADVLSALNERSPGQIDLHPFVDRLFGMAVPALRECLGSIQDTSKIPMLLASRKPSKWPQQYDPKDFFTELTRHSGIGFNIAQSRWFDKGHAGWFHAISLAQKRLSTQSGCDLAVVGGVDSFWSLSLIYKLLHAGRLLTERTSDGFIPGEGCGFVLLGTAQAVKRLKSQPLAWIKAAGLGVEPGHRASQEPHLGEGLDQAVKQALEGLSPRDQPIKTVFAGLNGESFNVKEWGVAFLRNRERFEPAYHIEHPAEYLGDAGAGLSAIMAVAAACGLSKRLWQGPILVWAASDHKERGAAVLSNTLK